MKDVWTSKEAGFTNKVVLSKLTGGNYWELPSCLWQTNAIRVAGTQKSLRQIRDDPPYINHSPYMNHLVTIY
jgi:hypothetical protein